MKTAIRLFFAAFVFSTAFSGSVFGQYWDSTYIDQMVRDNINLRRTEERMKDGRTENRTAPSTVTKRPPVQKNSGGDKDSAGSGGVSGSPDKLFFKPQPNRLLPRELVKNLPASEKAEMERTFTDALDFFETQLARKDFEYRNIAEVLALYVDFNYGIYRGGGLLPPEAYKALKKDIAAGLLRDGKFLTATDADKQMMYEARVISLVLLGDLFNDAKRRKNEERMKTLKEKAKRNVEQFFGERDIDSIEITASGVRLN